MTLSTQAWQTILNSIKNNEYTDNHLALRGLELNSVKANQLANALAHNEHITSLDLSFNKIGDSGLKALGANTTLTHLDLSYNLIGVSNTKAMIKAEAENQVLINVGLEPNLIESFSGLQALASNANLISLNLSRNDLGSKGAQILAQNHTLAHLSVQYNDIGAEGAIFLAENTSLISLDLSLNHIGLEGALALAHNTTLTTLCLGFPLIHFSSDPFVHFKYIDIGIQVAEAFSQNTTLTSLDLSGNKIGDVGAQALAKNTTLTDLHLGGENGWTKHEVVLGIDGIKALAQNTTLTSLNLFFNQLDNDSAQALSENSTLININLNDNKNIDSSWLKIFSDRISNHSEAGGDGHEHHSQECTSAGGDEHEHHSQEFTSAGGDEHEHYSQELTCSIFLSDILSEDHLTPLFEPNSHPVEPFSMESATADSGIPEPVSYSCSSYNVLNTLDDLHVLTE